MSVITNIDGVLSVNETSSDFDAFLEQYLLESSYSDISSRIRQLARDLKNGDADKDDIKDLYDEIKTLPIGDQTKAMISLGLVLVSFISFAMSAAFAGEAMLPAAVIAGLIAFISGILSNIIVSDSSTDKVYNELMKTQAVAMKNLRIAKENNDKDSIKINEKVIELCEECKKKRREALNAKSRNIKESSEELMLEYKGNEIKSNIFAQVLDDTDNLIKYFMERIETVDDNIEEMLKLANSSTKANISKNYMEIVKIGRGMNDELAKVKDIYGPMTWSNLSSQIKKFNNKYSELSMTQREALDEKMKSYLEKINKWISKYNDKKTKDRVQNIIDKCRALDGGTTAQIADVIYSWINFTCQEINYTKGDILSIIRDLNVSGIKKSLIYNLLNKSSTKAEMNLKK